MDEKDNKADASIGSPTETSGQNSNPVADEPQSKEQEYLNNWKRAEADLVNYRKDEQKRAKEVADFAKQVVIMGIIEIKDDLEEALKLERPGEKSAILDGVLMTMKKFNDVLSQNGISRIETAGQLFNPVYHEAISGEGERVGQEIRAGYKIGNNVLRPARVVITK